MPVQYENLHPAQAHQYQKLRRIALQTDPRSFGTTAEEFEQDTIVEVAQIMTQTMEDGGRYVLAFDEGEPVGMAVLVRKPPTRSKQRHIGVIVAVYVAPSHRGRGVARGLLTRLIAFAQTQPDLKILQLSVVTDNPAARRLYESLGFVVWGTEPCALRDDGGCVDQHHLALRL